MYLGGEGGFVNEPRRLLEEPDSDLERSLLQVGAGYWSPGARQKTLTALGIAAPYSSPLGIRRSPLLARKGGVKGVLVATALAPAAVPAQPYSSGVDGTVSGSATNAPPAVVLALEAAALEAAALQAVAPPAGRRRRAVQEAERMAPAFDSTAEAATRQSLALQSRGDARRRAGAERAVRRATAGARVVRDERE